MNVKETFLNWTKHTTPFGKEDEYLKDLLPSYLKKDSSGNYYYKIGNSDTMFTGHLDTVGGDKEIIAVEEDGIIKTDGKSVLGADDKAGVVILLYMIEKKVPGFYLFPIGEEVGCIGSGRLSKYLTDNLEDTKINLNNKKVNIKLPKNDLYKNIRKVISFDRMGYSSIITHQMDQRCCSDEFAESLSKELNKFGLKFELDDSGVYSDSAEFADIYPECTNVSVGYFNQHTNNEIQDIIFLEKLCIACSNIKWDKLPVYRNPADIEYLDNYYSGKNRGSGKIDDDRHRYIFDDEYDNKPSEHLKHREKDVKTIFFVDLEFDYISDVSFINNNIIDINISGDRLNIELNLIEKKLIENEVEYDEIFWDGLVLIIEHNKMETKIIRNDLLNHIPELKLENIKGYNSEEIIENVELE